MKNLAYLLLLVLAFSSCDNDCDGIVCFTPPEQFVFEITDAQSGENLFTNGTFTKDNIAVKNENNQVIEFAFISENEANLIQLSTIGWNTGAHQYILSIGSDLEIDLKLHTEEKHEHCCTFFETVEFDITSHEYEQSNTTGIITIKVSLQS